MSKEKAQGFIQSIIDGTMDPWIDAIISAVRARRNDKARVGIIGLVKGDKIRFSQTTRPAYLRGLVAVVKKVNGASVVVDVENNPAYGRFSGTRTLRVPASLVERV